MESLQTETVPPQGAAEEEVDDYYFQDPTTIGNMEMGAMMFAQGFFKFP